MPFYFWTVILGMAIGATLTWFLVADHPFETREAPAGPVDDLEAGIIVEELGSEGTELPEETIVRVLELHGRYIVGRRNARIHAEPATDAGETEPARDANDAEEEDAEPDAAPESTAADNAPVERAKN